MVYLTERLDLNPDDKHIPYFILLGILIAASAYHYFVLHAELVAVLILIVPPLAGYAFHQSFFPGPTTSASEAPPSEAPPPAQPRDTSIDDRIAELLKQNKQ